MLFWPSIICLHFNYDTQRSSVYSDATSEGSLSSLSSSPENHFVTELGDSRRGQGSTWVLDPLSVWLASRRVKLHPISIFPSVARSAAPLILILILRFCALLYIISVYCVSHRIVSHRIGYRTHHRLSLWRRKQTAAPLFDVMWRSSCYATGHSAIIS
jgi:hypothetical protein